MHIGYPKTATTSLQKSVFSTISSSEIIYRDNEQDAAYIKNFLSCVNEGRPLAQDFITSPRDLLISCEEVLFDSIRYRDRDSGFAPINHETIAGRTYQAVRRFAGPKKVIIVLRQQVEMIHSLYAQAYKHWFSEYDDLNTYRKYVSFLLSSEGGNIFNYARIVNDFQQQFGKENVGVLFYEDLDNGGAYFMEELSNFMNFALPKTMGFHNVRKMEVGRNSQARGLGDHLAIIKRKLLPTSNFGLGRFYRLMNSFTISKSEVIPFDDIANKLIYSQYSESNIVLAELVERDLSLLGYYNSELNSSND